MSKKKKSRNQGDKATNAIILVTAIIQLITVLTDLIDKLTG